MQLFETIQNKKYFSGENFNGIILLLFLPARTVLLIVSQAIFALYYRLAGNETPWITAGKWWTVWGNIADIGCIILLFVLTRRENTRIRDLLKPSSGRIFITGILFFLIVAPFSAMGSFAGSWLVYGSWHVILPPGELYARQLPTWGIIYSLVIWAPIWSLTEELSYNGYLAPRIDAFFGRRWVTLVLIGFWWALQHSFLPLIFDWRYIIWRFLSFVPCVLALNIVYLRTRKLPSLIVAHFIMDTIAAATTLSYTHQ